MAISECLFFVVGTVLADNTSMWQLDNQRMALRIDYASITTDLCSRYTLTKREPKTSEKPTLSVTGITEHVKLVWGTTSKMTVALIKVRPMAVMVMNRGELEKIARELRYTIIRAIDAE